MSRIQDFDFKFSDKDFSNISALAGREFGIHLEPAKKQLVYSRISKRIRSLKFETFSEYITYVSNPNGTEEKKHLLSALTTNVTHFFRENHHFDFLKNGISKLLDERARSREAVRIWSAGCSSGQEPYSICMLLQELTPRFKDLDFIILATDIDENILRTGLAAEYPLDQRNQIPENIREKYTKTDETGRYFTINKEIKEKVRFRQLNLIDPWPFKKKFDIIFCRNVAIYFSPETQEKVWLKFSDALNENGFLMIGHSERLSGPALNQLKNAGITTYQKTI